MIYTEETQELFKKRMPLIWEIIDNKISGLQIGITNYENEGDTDSAKKCEEECTRLIAEFDGLVYDLNL